MFYYTTEVLFKHYLKVGLSLIFFITEMVSAQDTLDKNITINIDNQTVTDALRDIEIKENLLFSYDAAIIKSNDKISKSFTDTPLRSVLDELFGDYKMYYHAKGTIIYIRKHAKKR